MKNLLTVLIFLCLISPLFSAVFHFEDTAGKKYRIKTLVKQDVYHNGIFVRSMDMMNKATLEALYTTNMTIQ